jgi:hypothetical protein
MCSGDQNKINVFRGREKCFGEERSVSGYCKGMPVGLEDCTSISESQKLGDLRANSRLSTVNDICLTRRKGILIIKEKFLSEILKLRMLLWQNNFISFTWQVCQFN